MIRHRRSLLRPRPGRSGTTTLEVAIVASAFIVTMMILIEASWQMAVGMALEHGARNASRFGSIGNSLPGLDRLQSIRAALKTYSGGLINEGPSNVLDIDPGRYGAWSDLGVPENRTPRNPGEGGAIVEYRITYETPAVTPFGWSMMRGTKFRHSTVVMVQNEPFPAQ